MPSGFVHGLKISATLRPPTALDEEWFSGDRELRTQAISAERGTRPRAAALALVLREGNGKVEMLVIKRAINPRDKWSGHIALPGGRQEAGESELQAAVRECEEEVGISLVSSRFSVLGRLKDTRTSTSKDALTVACFVFLQTDAVDLPVRVQLSEVACAWWVDTAQFYPDPMPREVGFAVTSMVKVARKPHWKALMWLFRAETAFFPCFFLPPPPLPQHNTAPDGTGASSSTVATLAGESGDAKAFVMWGLTFGVVSNLAVAAGGQAFGYEAPPYFRFRSFGADFLSLSYYKLKRWGRSLASSRNLLGSRR